MKSIKWIIVSLLVPSILLGYLAFSGMRITMGMDSPSKTMFAKQSLQLLSFFGHYSAPHMLASIRVFHTENEEERKEGFLFLEQEANSGSCYSAGKTGWAYQKGLGVNSDLEKAIALYEQAAKCGMTYWQILLSHAHKEGYLGFPVDEVKANYWIEMEPKTHIANYNCWVVTYYQDGTFPANERKSTQYKKLCDAGQNE